MSDNDCPNCRDKDLSIATLQQKLGWLQEQMEEAKKNVNWWGRQVAEREKRLAAIRQWANLAEDTRLLNEKESGGP